MDDIVKAALQKWPNVPFCYGWLGLDARGDWYLRDERVQAAGAFPVSKGSRIEHDKFRGFIHRNYEADERGAWFFQNGPQRVYVALEVAPLIFSVQRSGEEAVPFKLESHTGRCVAEVRAAHVDELGRLFLDTDVGFGLVHSLDMDVAADAISACDWPLCEATFTDLVQQFGYVLQPVA